MNQPLEETDITPTIHVAPSPHVSSMVMTTQGMMRDVLMALIPVVGAAFLFFGWLAVKQLLTCVAASLAAEALFPPLRGRHLWC